MLLFYEVCCFCLIKLGFIRKIVNFIFNIFSNKEFNVGYWGFCNDWWVEE